MPHSIYSTAGLHPTRTHLDMVKNDADGYVFKIDPWQYLDRLLLCGTDDGTFYVDAHTLTERAFEGVHELLKLEPHRLIKRVVELATSNRLPKIDPALFVMAMAASHKDGIGLKPRYQYASTHVSALREVLKIFKTPTHLMQFLSYVQKRRGWGRALKRMVQEWFKNTDAKTLALYSIKYYNRHGWTLRDLLRCSHLKFSLEPKHYLDHETNDIKISDAHVMHGHVLKWILERDKLCEEAKRDKSTNLVIYRHPWLRTLFNEFPMLSAWFAIHCPSPHAEPVSDSKIVSDFNLPREALPTEWLKEKKVWEALLVKMPIMALVRNLGVMGSRGLFDNFSNHILTVANRLDQASTIHESGLHPLFLFKAALQYQIGRGEKGSLAWNPHPVIVEGLEKAFHHALPNVHSFTKKVLVAWDRSGSMTSVAPVVGALAHIFSRVTSPSMVHIGFNTELQQFHAHNFRSLRGSGDLYRSICDGGTDCSVPFQYLSDQQLTADAVVLITDNETWAGKSSPQKALDDYRAQYNPNLKTVCLALTPTSSSVVNPSDPNTLGICGFDPLIWDLMYNFIEAPSLS